MPQFNVATAFNIVAYTLFLYDYVLTFADEVELFWSRPRRSWAFLLFFANRYITLLGRVPPSFTANFLASKFGPYSPLCDSLLLADQLTMGIVQLTGSIVMTLRVYAMYGESRRVLYFLLSFIGIGAGVALWALLVNSNSSLPAAPVQGHGCLRFISQQQSLHYAVAWGTQLIFDATVFVLTTWKLLRMESMGKRSLVDILLRDGAMYFAVMTTINVANIIVFIAGRPDMKSVLSSPTNMLCAALISRLMLNLRDPIREEVNISLLDIDSIAGSSRMRRLLLQEEPFAGVDWRSVRNPSMR